MPPITNIVASNNPRRAARVGRGSVSCESVSASRDGVESAKNERARNEYQFHREQAARIYHRCQRGPSVARSCEPACIKDSQNMGEGSSAPEVHPSKWLINI